MAEPHRIENKMKDDSGNEGIVYVDSCREYYYIIPRFFMEMVSMREANRFRNSKDAIIVSIGLLALSLMGALFGVSPIFPNYLIPVGLGISLTMNFFYEELALSFKHDRYVLKDCGPDSWQRRVILLTYNIVSSINKIAYITIGLSTIQLCLSRSLFSLILSYAELEAVIRIVSYRTLIDKEIDYKLDIVRMIAIVAPVSIAARFFVNVAMSPVYFLPLVVVFWFMAYLLVTKYFHKIMSIQARPARGTKYHKRVQARQEEYKHDDNYATVLEGHFGGAIVYDEKFYEEEKERAAKKHRETVRELEKMKAERKAKSERDALEERRRRAKIEELSRKSRPYTPAESKPRNRRIGFGWYDEETYQNYLRDYELGPYSPDYKEKDPQPKSKEETGGYVEIEDDNTSVDRFRNKR